MNEKFFCGYPEDFNSICKVYPPKVKDFLSNPKTSLYMYLLTISIEDIEDIFLEQQLPLNDILSPLQYLLNYAFSSAENNQNVMEAFEFFIHESIILNPKMEQIIIGDISDTKDIQTLKILGKDNFFDFQNLIREACGKTRLSDQNLSANPKVREMKAKSRYRDKIKSKEGKNLNFFTILSSLCCTGMGLNPLNIGDLSYASISVLIKLYQDKEKYTLDIESLLAGAKNIKPVYWIKNVDNE